MSQGKECSGCTFCVSMSGFQVGAESVSIPYCYHKRALVDLGTGEKFPSMCEDMRKDGAACGPEGSLYAQYFDVPPIVVSPVKRTLSPWTRGRTGSNKAASNNQRQRRPAPYKEQV